jgi:phosphonate transport system substrate-binding protein
MGKHLRVGLIPFRDPALGEAFAAALSDVLGTPVDVHVAADYRGLVAALEQGLVQLAWVPPLMAARGVREGTIVPSVVTLRNGTTSYSACLFSLRAGGPDDLSKLRGARAAWVDRESASGYVVIRAHLRSLGMRLVDAFGDEIFVRSHADVGRAVRERAVDVGATFLSFRSGSDEIDRAGWREGGLDDRDVQVLAHAGPIPSDVLALHPTLASVRALLQTALVDARPASVHLAAKALLHADGFARPTEAHLLMLRTLLASVEPGSTMPPPRMP